MVWMYRPRDKLGGILLAAPACGRLACLTIRAIFNGLGMGDLVAHRLPCDGCFLPNEEDYAEMRSCPPKTPWDNGSSMSLQGGRTVRLQQQEPFPKLAGTCSYSWIAPLGLVRTACCMTWLCVHLSGSPRYDPPGISWISCGCCPMVRHAPKQNQHA